MKQQHRLWIIGIVAVLLVAVVAFTRGNPAGPEKTLALQAPAFLDSVSSTNTAAPPEVAAMLSSEAGISAYIQTADSITLSSVRGEFRTIETETTDYIIGSVAVPDHPEQFDVHVYVHTDGWILAYYINTDPTGKIADVRASTVNGTKLDTILAIVAGAAGYPAINVKYYDFRYPNATHILMVAEDQADGWEFNITMPTDYGYFERSFGVYNNYYDSGAWVLYINGTAATRSWIGSYMTFGSIPASQLLPGQTHLIALNSNGSVAYGVLVITYRVQ